MNAFVPKSHAKVFIVDVSATMLKQTKELKLSAKARMVYLTMRALANGKTGHLAIQSNPLDWRYISKCAGVGRDVWQRSLNELMAAGYVTRQRESVEIYQRGRKRVVWGRAHYWVHRQPKVATNSRTSKKPYILPMPDFSAAEESGTQFLSNPPSGVECRGGGLSSEIDSRKVTQSNHRHPEKETDDDSVFVRAKRMLLETRPAEEAPYIENGLEMIGHRVHESGIKPASPQYYIQAYENLKTSQKDWDVVQWCVESPNSNDHRRKVNALILLAEKESKRTGRPVIDVFHDLRQNPHCYEVLGRDSENLSATSDSNAPNCTRRARG